MAASPTRSRGDFADDAANNMLCCAPVPFGTDVVADCGAGPPLAACTLHRSPVPYGIGEADYYMRNGKLR